MDLKLKGRTWVGNIYQKFEAVCQEVDEFVSQDTIKYVENQVQTVGGSMKKFCSNVVQDLIPPLADPAKSEAQSISSKENDTIGNYIISVMGIHEKPELDPSNESTPLSSIDPIKDEEPDLSLANGGGGGGGDGDGDDALIYKKIEVVVEKNVVEEEPHSSDDLEIISPKNKELSGALSNESVSNNSGDIIPLGGSPPTLITSADLESSQKEGTVWSSFLDGADSVSDVPSTLESFSTVSCNSKAADMGFAFSSSVFSLESNDVDITGTDETSSLAGSSGNGHEHCCECTEIVTSMTSLEIGGTEDFRIDISDPSMESIELSDKVKLDQSSVFVDDKLLYAVSCRARNLRSYKKIIQDAFTSKKRLIKDYEQLAIWYGDVDVESSQHSDQNRIPLTRSTSLDSRKSSTHDLCDSEWELL